MMRLLSSLAYIDVFRSLAIIGAIMVPDFAGAEAYRLEVAGEGTLTV
jgi:hypothetical protein